MSRSSFFTVEFSRIEIEVLDLMTEIGHNKVVDFNDQPFFSNKNSKLVLRVRRESNVDEGWYGEFLDPFPVGKK